MEKGMKINVLGEGFVEYVDHMGDDLMVCNAARVSFNKETTFDEDGNLQDRDEKLIRYLAEHNHWTPFAHPQITLRIKTPISIRAQLGKHQIGLVMNEVSRRYVKDSPAFYVPRWRGAPTNGAKQGSSDFIEDEDLSEEFDARFINLCIDASQLYTELIDKGIAPEQARFALPQGMYTEWFWTGSLAAFARVCKQRLDTHAQWEVREVAKAISAIVEPKFPVSWKYLCN
jgi:thymidylate synthase (FAD)